MAAKQVQVRRDTASNVNLVIPADGEIAYNLSDDRIHMGDGSTYGGIPHANFRDIQNSKFEYAADSGSANAITISLPYAPGSYTAGLRVRFKANATNTGATTINVNGLGTKNLQKYTSGTLGALAAGDVVNGGIYEAVYDGTQFQIQTYIKGGITSVSQGNLNTSTGSISISGNGTANYSCVPGTAVALPGGEYGFFPRTTAFANGGSGQGGGAVAIGGNSTGAYVCMLMGSGNGNSTTGSASLAQRYVTSSPPFAPDFGTQQEAAGFVFVLVDPDGKIVCHYAADVPPWAYNGPTDIRATRICANTGKKFKMAMRERTLEEIMDGAKIMYEEQEITQAVKNADMGLIPHPFGAIPPGHRVILLNPYDDRVKDLIEYMNAGGNGAADEIGKAILSGKISFDQEKMDFKGPSGVGIHRMKFKYSGRKG